jgi:hypothetical protein
MHFLWMSARVFSRYRQNDEKILSMDLEHGSHLPYKRNNCRTHAKEFSGFRIKLAVDFFDQSYVLQNTRHQIYLDLPLAMGREENIRSNPAKRVTHI